MTEYRNAMDDIIIKYGRPQATYSEIEKQIFEKVRTGKSTLEKAKKEIESAVKEVPLPEFLKIPKEELSTDEQKMQKVLNDIYSLNNTSVPIYCSFPKGKSPLKIDMVYLCTDVLGAYRPSENRIIFSQINKLTYTDLVETLSHELKHAQQGSIRMANNYQMHQLRFLKEAQANACSDRVLYALCPNHPQAKNFKNWHLLFYIFGDDMDKYLHDSTASNAWSLKNTEEICMLDYLKRYLTDKSYKNMYEFYKDSYDSSMPIRKGDTALTKIPDVFDIIRSKETLSILKKYVSKKARTPFNQIRQIIANRDRKAFTILLNAKDKHGKFILNKDFLDSVVLTTIISEEQNHTTDFFEILLKSNRLSKKQMENACASIVHISEEETLTDELLKSKMALLKVLLSYKDTNGKHIISSTKVEECVNTEQDIAEIEINGGEKQAKITKEAKKIIHSMKPTLQKTLKKAQISARKKNFITKASKMLCPENVNELK